jgi:hypothetical protein
MANEPTLSEALGDVRRAYRLLWCYQERMFDIIRTIEGEFESLRFYVWESHNAARIDGSTNPLSRNPWFAFPMMNVSLLYRSDGDSNLAKPGDWLLDIRIVSDSGYNDEENWRAAIDPTGFPDIEASESKLNLYVYFCTGEVQGNWLRHIWGRVEWPDTNEEVHADGDLPIMKIGVSLNLADLTDREAVQHRVRSFKKSASAALGAELR